MIVNSKTPVTCQEWCTTFSVVYNKIHPAKNNVISWLKKDTLKYGMNLQSETIAQIFRKIIQLNVVIILKSTNEYYRKIISKSGRKMDLYPAMLSSVIDLAHPESSRSLRHVVSHCSDRTWI